EAELRIALRLPGPAVPHDHGAAAVLALRDVALEGEIFERVILCAHGQPLLADHKGRPTGDRPALERAVELEAQVVMQAARRMTLDHEGMAGDRGRAL